MSQQTLKVRDNFSVGNGSKGTCLLCFMAATNLRGILTKVQMVVSNIVNIASMIIKNNAMVSSQKGRKIHLRWRQVKMLKAEDFVHVQKTINTQLDEHT